ncbi:MAG: PTS IIA-like nitrogen regulatory protein PtsN [Maricaulaceae bacterium]|jgi:PTS system nitrogen regulatory IIA component
MTLEEILGENGVVANLKATSKKHLFNELARLASETVGVPQRAVFDAVLERERLGSTGVGGGVAIPHARLVGLDQISGVLARLENPIDFESIDDQPIDLVFMLLAPNDAGADHLKALAKVSRLLRRPEMRDRLRAAPDADAMRALISETQSSNAA